VYFFITYFRSFVLWGRPEPLIGGGCQRTFTCVPMHFDHCEFLVITEHEQIVSCCSVTNDNHTLQLVRFVSSFSMKGCSKVVHFIIRTIAELVSAEKFARVTLSTSFAFLVRLSCTVAAV